MQSLKHRKTHEPNILLTNTETSADHLLLQQTTDLAGNRLRLQECEHQLFLFHVVSKRQQREL